MHDSPDYYQLKLSVFNDDKKTELIGESWIDLRDIIVTGGGQSDDWQTLTCKGKYAGDIRIEITFYDSRPKPEKQHVPKPKPVDMDHSPAQQKVPKRRPLPSDPYTGQAPAQPPQPAPATTRPLSSHPRDYSSELAIHDLAPRAPQTNSPYPANHAHSQSAQYGNPPSLRGRHHDNYSGTSSSYHRASSRADAPRGSLDRDRYSVYPDDPAFPPDHHGHTPDTRYTQASPYGTLTNDPAFGPDINDERPPPPPAHRTTPGATPEPKHIVGRDIMHQTQTPPILRKDVLRQEAHRQPDASNAYPGRPVYRAYDSAPASAPPGNDPYAIGGQQLSQPRHHSFDAHYETHHRSLQPTVEDVPDSPGSGLVDEYSRRASHAPPYDEVVHRNDPSPAPLNLSGRSSAPSLQHNAPHGQSVSPDYTRSEISSRASTSQISYDTRSSYASYPTGHEVELPVPQARPADSVVRFEMPAVPTSLIPGMDPALMEISQRINDGARHERRHSTQPPSQNPPVGSTRGRQMVDPPPTYAAPPRDTSQHYNPPHHGYDSYDRSTVLYNGGVPAQQLAMMRDMSPGHSPSGHNTIKRKSVSPVPPPESRRLSGVPFGPDSYDALNPSIAPPKPNDPNSQDYDELNGKIITYDGREVDPSDHLPMDTWAPEPEPKTGKRSSSESSSRPSLSGPQPPPRSGRKPLRIRERPASSFPSATYMSPEAKNPLPPPGTGRNRLQKRANRNSAMPVMMSGANGPGLGALAPLSQLPQDRDNFAPRAPARASTFDYENHAPLPMYDTFNANHYGGARDHSASAPPIPAKIPLAASTGTALVPMGYRHGGDGHGGGELTLMEEMSRIDIGSGRARRHTQRPAIGGY